MKVRTFNNNQFSHFCGRFQLGQSMIEYTVVSVFGILLITSNPMRDQVTALMDSIRENYRGYSFAISLSDIPDSNTPGDYDNMLASQAVTDKLRLLLTDSNSNNQIRDPSDYQQAVKNYSLQLPPNDVRTVINQHSRNLQNFTIP